MREALQCPHACLPALSGRGAALGVTVMLTVRPYIKETSRNGLSPFRTFIKKYLSNKLGYHRAAISFSNDDNNITSVQHGIDQNLNYNKYKHAFKGLDVMAMGGRDGGDGPEPCECVLTVAWLAYEFRDFCWTLHILNDRGSQLAKAAMLGYHPKCELYILIYMCNVYTVYL